MFLPFESVALSARDIVLDTRVKHNEPASDDCMVTIYDIVTSVTLTSQEHELIFGIIDSEGFHRWKKIYGPEREAAITSRM
jgi:hypothetical protein